MMLEDDGCALLCIDHDSNDRLDNLDRQVRKDWKRAVRPHPAVGLVGWNI